VTTQMQNFPIAFVLIVLKNYTRPNFVQCRCRLNKGLQILKGCRKIGFGEHWASSVLA